jgi:hypothetical protein
MKRLLCFVLLLFPAAATAQFPYPYSLPIQTSISNTNVCAFNTNVTSGNLLIVTHGWYNSTSSTSISDTRSVSWTRDAYSNAGSGPTGGLFYSGTLASSGAETITITISGESFMQTQCYEFPPSFSLTVDGTPTTTNYSGSPATINGGAVTTTLSGDILISLAEGFHNNSICGPKDPRGALGNLKYIGLGMARNNDGGCVEYQVTGAPGSYSNSFTNWQNMDQGLVVTVAYKANAMHISTPLAIPNGALSKTYDYTLGYAGAAASVTWSGTPPAGLSLNSSTGEITGTPTSSNHYSFSISASDGTTTDTQTLTMDVVTAFSAITLVQAKSNTGGLGPPVTFTSNVTSGNTLVIFASDNVGTFYAGSPALCIDSVGTIFHRVTLNTMIFDYNPQIFIGYAASSGADGISCNSAVSGSPASGLLIGMIAEFSNVQNFGDLSTVTLNTTASPISGATLTTLAPDSLVLAMAVGRTFATTFTAQSPFTAVGSTINLNGEYDITSTVTGYTAAWTMASNTDGNWMVQAIGLRPSSGTVSASSTIRHRVVQ